MIRVNSTSEIKQDSAAGSKAVVYARVSSQEQSCEGFSIPAQLKLLKTYADQNKLLIVQQFIDIESAKNTGRSGFNLREFLGACSGVTAFGFSYLEIPVARSARKLA